MSQYLTYAALRTSQIEKVLQECHASAHKLGVRFEIPFGPSDEAHTWIGVFENGWTFALADPAVWELPNLFQRVARDQSYECVTGSTDGDFKKWTYEYFQGGQSLHRFNADPSGRYAESEYGSMKGDPTGLADVFGVSMAKLRSQMRQFNAAPVQEFLQTLGFEITFASKLRFVILTKGSLPAVTTGAVSLAVVREAAQLDSEPNVAKGPMGATTKAYRVVKKAAEQGYGTAAGMRALRFGEESDFDEAHDLFFRLRRDRRHLICLEMADSLVQRYNANAWSDLPSPHRELRGTTIYSLRGMALYSLERYDEAIFELRDRALAFNRYMGPQHRSKVARMLGDALVRTRDYEGALEWLDLALAERPLHAPSWANLAQVMRRLDRVNEARQAALLGLAADPEFEAWPGLKASLDIRDTDLLPPRKEEYARRYRHEAQDMMRAGDKVRAISSFRIALHHDPANIDCAWGVACAINECLREGLIESGAQDWDLVRLLDQVCFGNPAWPWSWGTLIEVHDRQGHRELALKAGEAYATMHVTRLDDLQNVSIWLANMNPELGVVMLEKLNERFVDLRMKGMSAGADRDRSRFKALSMLGWALLATGKAQEAITPLTEAVQLDGSSADNRANLAMAQIQLGNSHEAALTVSRGLRASPNHPRLLELQQQLRGT